ncbi:hypothetical protein [Halomicrobium sp. LC1Hm]|uniref:hypothetical protein n=1 Tax=Halomicrobium sp. LC1Hm TaxID=2610902 RepID=UPI00129835A2|nr:hypothetical protein [Halomicrobium sp. LC1Hm]
MSSDETAQAGVGEPPERCPICETAYDSVSVHEEGVAVNLIENERFRRVCFEPVDDGGPQLRFYHHTHEQAGTTPSSERGTPGGRVP